MHERVAVRVSLLFRAIKETVSKNSARVNRTVGIDVSKDSVITTLSQFSQSAFCAAQIEIWKGGTKVCLRAAFTRLVSRLKASRFTAGLSMKAIINSSPFLTGFSSGFSHEGK